MSDTAIHDKVVASSLGVAFSQVLIWVLERVPSIGDIPFAVEGAIAVILTAAAGSEGTQAHRVSPRLPPAPRGRKAPDRNQGRVSVSLRGVAYL